MAKLNDVQATKQKHVDDILRNSVYLPEAGMMKRLRRVLLKLSNDDLGCLMLAVGIQIIDFAQPLVEACQDALKLCEANGYGRDTVQPKLRGALKHAMGE